MTVLLQTNVLTTGFPGFDSFLNESEEGSGIFLELWKVRGNPEVQAWLEEVTKLSSSVFAFNVIPEEWVEQTLADPEKLKQALEQLAISGVMQSACNLPVKVTEVLSRYSEPSVTTALALFVLATSISKKIAHQLDLSEGVGSQKGSLTQIEVLDAYLVIAGEGVSERLTQMLIYQRIPGFLEWAKLFHDAGLTKAALAAEARTTEEVVSFLEGFGLSPLLREAPPLILPHLRDAVGRSAAFILILVVDKN